MRTAEESASEVITITLTPTPDGWSGRMEIGEETFNVHCQPSAGHALDCLPRVIGTPDYKRACLTIAGMDEWTSAASFMESTADVLDRFQIERPDHYDGGTF